MNRLTLHTGVIFVCLLAVACTNKKQDADNASDQWPAMDKFHDRMAASFHPYKDSANLEPAKSHATELAQAADAWANAPLPEKLNNDEMKESLNQLRKDANAFAQLVQSGDSVMMGESLTALHTSFHKIQEAWYNGRKEGGHNEATHAH